MSINYFNKFLKLFAKGYKIKLFVLLVMSIIAGILEFIGIALIYPFIILVLHGENFNANYVQFFKLFPTQIQPQDYHSAVFLVGILIIFAFIAKNVFMIINWYYETFILQNWLKDVSLFFFKKHLFSTYEEKFQIPEPYNLFQIFQLIPYVFNTYVIKILNFFSTLIIASIILAFLVIKFRIWAILTVAFFVITGLLQNKFFKTVARNLIKEKISTMQNSFSTFLSTIDCSKDIKLFSKENYFYNLYKKYVQVLANIDIKVHFYNGVPQYVVEIFIILAIVLLTFGIIFTNSNNASAIVASYGVIAAAIFRLAPLVNKVQFNLNYINTNKDAMIKLLNATEIYEKLTDLQPYISDKKLTFKNLIEIKNLEFNYYNKEDAIIENLNLNIKKGEFIGIIGQSGIGKSTLFDLLMGLLFAKKGEILIDGVKLTLENSSQWINSLSYVPQNIKLISATIAENIAWGEALQNIDISKIQKAATLAKIDDFINTLEDNYFYKLNTMQNISQGQIQRIAIARALYKCPDIIFFDEITSSLDIETEKAVIDTIVDLKKAKTIFVISHKLKTLEKCDRILYIKSGHEFIFSTFSELLNSDKDFINLINLEKFN